MREGWHQDSVSLDNSRVIRCAHACVFGVVARQGWSGRFAKARHVLGAVQDLKISIERIDTLSLMGHGLEWDVRPVNEVGLRALLPMPAVTSLDLSGTCNLAPGHLEVSSVGRWRVCLPGCQRGM